MSTVRRSLAGVALTALATMVALGPGAPSSPTSAAEVAAMAPLAQAKLLQPLRALAQTLDAEGRAAWRATYSGVEIDAPDDVVRLYVTAGSAGATLVARARRRQPTEQWSRVRVSTSAHSLAALDYAAQRVVAGHQADVEDVSVPANGSGLQVRVRRPDTTGLALATGPGIGVEVQSSAAANAKSWSDTKWHDSVPFIGGDTLTATGSSICTAGLPAVQIGSLRPVLITASHCFTAGQRVYTGGGTTGAIGNGKVGTYVGTAGARNSEWDAVELTGSGSNADESDTTGWKPLTSVAYSYDGDYVCQDGAASFFLGHPTPCGIEVTDDDVWFSIGGHMARGVEGVDMHTGWGSHNGDSGATVFAFEPGGARQARGIVSSGGHDGTSDQRRVDWTEAVDIFRALDLKLNPQT